MEIVGIDNYDTALNKAIQTIVRGGLVVFPSDTVYGLAVDPENQKAVEKLLSFKDRWTGKAVSVAVADTEMASRYVEMSDEVKRIYKNLLPGPFTIVSTGRHITVKGIEAENGTLGIRIPKNKFMNDLARNLGKAYTATSANLSGEGPHYSIENFLKSISKKKKEMIDLIVDGGKLPQNKPSTVIDITQPEIKVLRRGDLITGGEGQTLESKSEEETEKIAEFILDKYMKDNLPDKPLVVALTGDLGCGKTVFSRAIGKHLGVEEKITSPTFFIYNEYSIRSQISDVRFQIKKFLHFDLYRIKDKYELEEINFLDLFEPRTVACIEWPENMGEDCLELLKAKSNFYTIGFEYIDETTREIKY